MAIHNPALLMSRGELLEQACQKVVESWYQLKKSKSRSKKLNPDQQSVPRRSKIDFELRQRRMKELKDDMLDEEIAIKHKQHQAMSKLELKELLTLAQSDCERESLCYVVCKASGISSTAARKQYGLERMDEQVKGAGVYPKNPAWHITDLEMLESCDVVKLLFLNPTTNEPKPIECIQVAGGSDEDPGHIEVQFWWTLRHIATLVSSQNSGASYLNRVELPNGCLALGHSNLFIPSNLKGTCFDHRLGRWIMTG